MRKGLLKKKFFNLRTEKQFFILKKGIVSNFSSLLTLEAA